MLLSDVQKKYLNCQSIVIIWKHENCIRCNWKVEEITQNHKFVDFSSFNNWQKLFDQVDSVDTLFFFLQQMEALILKLWNRKTVHKDCFEC